MPELESYSVTIKEDNEEAPKLANNKHASRRTGHIDVKHHIIRDTMEQGKSASRILRNRNSSRIFSRNP